MVDNSNVLVLANNLMSTDKTRHILRRDMVVREREAQGSSKVTKIGTKENIADILTKVLVRDVFEPLRCGLMQLLRAGLSYVHLVSPDARRRRAAHA